MKVKTQLLACNGKHKNDTLSQKEPEEKKELHNYICPSCKHSQLCYENLSCGNCGNEIEEDIIEKKIIELASEYNGYHKSWLVNWIKQLLSSQRTQMERGEVKYVSPNGCKCNVTSDSHGDNAEGVMCIKHVMLLVNEEIKKQRTQTIEEILTQLLGVAECKLGSFCSMHRTHDLTEYIKVILASLK